MSQNFEVIKENISGQKGCCNYKSCSQDCWNVKDINKEPDKENIEYRNEDTSPCVMNKFLIKKEFSNFVL